ncbi:hypothetical protein [Actinobacillus porcinus]|uniref:Uncharacterized protein n=1 Tax=Actinobacillus porcinus TaxID=51048 RepID=A0ABY6TJ26_9PAST|nr:hypothetical protein [Actinobacillus porcinus]MDD7544600.1 hypothetical protein [Actinobacillus porcinus]MDY5848104.1 hypothetical protein [Actinobacillus porcinus]VFY92367.1 Uncharacterised protein [Actinobacillus porcinus]VTU06369.1 Uncharacterised protein [Actinobacillus porcinus]
MRSVNSALSGAGVSSSAQASVDAAVNNAKPNSNAKALFNQAKPAISKYVALIACNTPTSTLSAYSDPDSSEPNGLGMPQHLMFHHKSGCLNVLRIDGIKKLAANTVEFQVVYISPQSEETTRKTMHAIKQPSGEWLFDFWGLR